MTLPMIALYLGGALHLGILIASALTPRALDWRASLATLPKLLRQMFWVYGAFIVLMIISFSVLTFALAESLAAGTPLARGVCAMIAVFWAVRLAVQFFVFDATPYLTHWVYRFGYHGLTLVFFTLVALYGWGATGFAFLPI